MKIIKHHYNKTNNATKTNINKIKQYGNLQQRQGPKRQAVGTGRT